MYNNFSPRTPNYLRPRNPYSTNIEEEDNDYIPTKQQLQDKPKIYSNVYLKRVNFRTEFTDIIKKACYPTKNMDEVIRISDYILMNVYFEEQLERSNADILSESLRIETERILNRHDLHDMIKRLVEKYF